MRRLDERGETLVEVIMALGILSLVLVSSYALATGTFRLGRGAGDRTQAVNYLQEQAEALRSYRNRVPWGQEFTSKIGNYAYSNPFAAFCMKQENDGANGLRWMPVNAINTSDCIFDGVTITIHPTAESPQQYKFDLKATWKTGSEQNNVTLTTKLTDQTP